MPVYYLESSALVIKIIRRNWFKICNWIVATIGEESVLLSQGNRSEVCAALIGFRVKRIGFCLGGCRVEQCRTS
jgi:hypothetical protein